MKKLAIIVGGWHYPARFYNNLFMQTIPEGWAAEVFVVAHRPPITESLKAEKAEALAKDVDYIYLDRDMYQAFATEELIDHFGFHYSLEQNTIGDLEFFNQWLSKNNWQEYDMFLFAHDDTQMLSFNFIADVLERKATLYKKADDGVETILGSPDDDWVWLSNSTTPFYYHIRNSLDFIHPSVVEHVGGYFDSRSIKLERTYQTNTPPGHMDLAEWNKWVRIIQDTLKSMGRIEDTRFLSEDYRISDYAIEGERGMISNMNADTHLYLQGLENRGITKDGN